MALATQGWLDQTREEPLDPELEICDPHHHLWDRPESRFMLEELVADAAHGAPRSEVRHVVLTGASGADEQDHERSARAIPLHLRTKPMHGWRPTARHLARSSA